MEKILQLKLNIGVTMNEDNDNFEKFYKKFAKKIDKKQQKEVVKRYKETVGVLKFAAKVLMYLREEYNISKVVSSIDDVNVIIENCFNSKENVPNTASEIYFFLKNHY